MTPLYWPLFWMLVMGTMTATYQLEILSKPLSYTLPGHRRIVRKLLFGFNCFGSLLCAAMVLLLYPRDLTSRCCAAGWYWLSGRFYSGLGSGSPVAAVIRPL
jgi:MFS family permease